MADSINQYGDQFRPTDNGHGVDISSQRQDELDVQSLAYIREQAAGGRKILVVDLGGGFGAHSIRMAETGAAVTMIDIADMATENFSKAVTEKSIPTGDLRFLHRDFSQLENEDIPENFDVLYSQRAIHYVSYPTAEKVLHLLFSRMAQGGAVYISAAGYDTEYGKTYPDRAKPVEERFNYVTPDMQEKHGITHKITTYKEEDMAVLLKTAGFGDIQVTHSGFGNIKAMARKP
ncbi:MAG TPA: class I SAM-dependent methyltransferase [Alphaproteobacteria bacterium]